MKNKKKEEKKILHKLPISIDLYEKINNESIKRGLTINQLRREILYERYIKTKEINNESFKFSSKKIIKTISINETVLNKIDEMNKYGSRSRIIEKLLIAFLSEDNLILSDDDISLLNKIKNEINSIGRNINQITRIINTEIKFNNDPKGELLNLLEYLKKLKLLIDKNNNIITSLINKNNGILK